VPKTFPIPAVRAIANAPQNVTRAVARRTFAPPALASIAPKRARKPKDAAGYGMFWFLGSAAIGFLYDFSLLFMIAFCVAAELAAVPIFIWVGRHANAARDRRCGRRPYATDNRGEDD
jgi:hypothetical protein